MKKMVSGTCKFCHAAANTVTATILGLHDPRILHSFCRFEWAKNPHIEHALITFCAAHSITTPLELEGFITSVIEGGEAQASGGNLLHELVTALLGPEWHSIEQHNVQDWCLSKCKSRLKETGVQARIIALIQENAEKEEREKNNEVQYPDINNPANNPANNEPRVPPPAVEIEGGRSTVAKGITFIGGLLARFNPSGTLNDAELFHAGAEHAHNLLAIVQQYDADIDKKREEISTLSRDIDKKRNEQQRIDGDIATQQAELTTIQDDIIAERAKLSKLQHDVERKTQELEQLRQPQPNSSVVRNTSVVDANADLERITSSIKEKERSLKRIEEMIEARQHSLNGPDADAEGHQTVHTTMKRNTIQRKTANTGLQAEFKRHQISFATIESNITQHKRALATLEADIGRGETSLATVESNTTQRKTSLTIVEEDIDRRKASLVAIQDDIFQAGLKLGNLNEDVRQKQKNLATLGQEEIASKAQLEEVRARVDSSQSTLSQARAALAEMRADSAKIKREIKQYWDTTKVAINSTLQRVAVLCKRFTDNRTSTSTSEEQQGLVVINESVTAMTEAFSGLQKYTEETVWKVALNGKKIERLQEEDV